MTTKIPQRLKNTFRRRNLKKSVNADSCDESSINQSFETYDMTDIFSFEKEDKIFSTIRSNDSTETLKVLLTPPLLHVSDKKKNPNLDIPENILTIIDSSMESQFKTQNKKKEPIIQHNRIIKAQSEYMERDVSSRAKAKSEWKRRLRQRKIDRFREEQRSNNVCANTDIFNHGNHINRKNDEKDSSENSNVKIFHNSSKKNYFKEKKYSLFEDGTISNRNGVNSESNEVYSASQIDFNNLNSFSFYPNHHTSDSSAIQPLNGSKLDISNDISNNTLTEMEKNVASDHLKYDVTQSKANCRSTESFSIYPTSEQGSTMFETHLSSLPFKLDSIQNSNKQDETSISSCKNETKKIVQIPSVIPQLEENLDKLDFKPAIVDFKKSRSCPRTTVSLSDSSIDSHIEQENASRSYDGNMPSVKNLRKWLNNFETKNKEYQRNIGNRGTSTDTNNKKGPPKDMALHEQKLSSYNGNRPINSAHTNANVRAVDVRINCDDNSINKKEDDKIEFSQSSLRRNVAIRSIADNSKFKTFRISPESGVNCSPQINIERRKPSFEKNKASPLHRSNSYGSIVDLYPNYTKNVKSYVPVQKPMKQKIDKKDVAATNDTRVSVSKISEWLSNDPFETKKSKTIKRGMNVMMKSLKFEPDQRSPVNIEVMDPIGGNVSDRKKWIENCFKKNIDDKDELSNSNKVADRARWLQEEAFSKQTARF